MHSRLRPVSSVQEFCSEGAGRVGQDSRYDAINTVRFGF